MKKNNICSYFLVVSNNRQRDPNYNCCRRSMERDRATIVIF